VNPSLWKPSSFVGPRGGAPLELGRDDRLSETMLVTTFGYPFGRALTFRRNGYPDITILEGKITSLKKDEGKLRKIHLRAAPGGGLFGSWCISHGPSGIQTIAVSGRSIRLDYLHESAGHVVPGADGQTIFTGSGDRRRSDAQPLDPATRQARSAEVLIPSTSPSYYLGITAVNPVSGQASGSVAATVRLASDGTEIVTVQELTEMAGASRAERGDVDGMTIDKRFHFIPAANLLITVPPTNGRLVLRRLDLDRAIASSEKPAAAGHLALRALRPTTARPGSPGAGPLQQRSCPLRARDRAAGTDRVS
jgi:hypothetical protein